MERRKDFNRAVTIRLFTTDQVNELIRELKEAKKITLKRGGHKTVIVKDAREPGVRVFISVDLTGDALRRM